MLSEGDTRNRWRDGQVCPYVGQGTMAPWARRLGGRERETEREGRGDGKRRERRRKESREEETEKERERVGDGKREERSRREREEPALYGDKGGVRRLEWKDDERRWR
ncbi:hypothetical protein TNCV_3035901 [Trichonephila clavipes]|nr:hypothetical protein TNCV_3035901 [Trichonephila clavipes]